MMPIMRPRRLLLLAAPLLLAPALASQPAPATAATTKPIVRGTLSRWPTPAKNVLGAVTAIDANSGAIVGTAAAPKGSYRLALPTGTYILIGRASDLRRGRARFLSSNVVALGQRGQTVDLPGDPPLKAKRATPRTLARAAATGGSGGSVGIGGIPVTTASGLGLHGGNGIDPLVQGLLPQCQKNDEKLIDISKQVTEARAREQQFSDDGRTETRLTVDQSTPDRIVTGKVTIDADGKPVVDITITDGKTGEVIDHVRTAGDKDSTIDDVGDLLRRVGRGVGQRDCKPDPQPPAPPAPAAPAPAPKAPVITPPDAAPSGLITITYSGSEDVTNSLYSGGVVQTFHTDWAESRTATRDGWAIGATPWAFSQLNGTISSIRTAGSSCTATLSPPAAPDQYYNMTTVFPPVVTGTGHKTWYVQTGGVPSWHTFTVSSDTNPSSDCAPDRVYFFEPPEALSQPGDALDQQWYDAWAPSVDLPDDSSVTFPVNFTHTWTSDCGGGDQTCTLDVNVQSVITLSKS
jgi:hypothetical protein